MKYKNQILCGDCLKILPTLPSDSIDLVFGSPPYEDARTYGIDFNLKGQDWVDWMVEVYKESLRVCKGLVAFVIQGRTRKFRWSATPALLMADLHRIGIHLRDGPYYHRYGIPGSGSKDWLRHDIEFVICATNGGRLPWSDNIAMGHKPKWAAGGPSTHQTQSGKQVNTNYTYPRCRRQNGTREIRPYFEPKVSNPGTLISVGATGGGHMGSKLAHENEAPFSDKLAEFMIRSFCPPGGLVLDSFSGSGTTVSVAKKFGRRYCGIDIRKSQCELTQRRLKEVLEIKK